MGLANLKQVRIYIDVEQGSNESVRSKIGDILLILRRPGRSAATLCRLHETSR
jgi:hypothetical protein